MTNYKTIEEKASEWKMTSRYVQGLCRQGKITGAIKKSGMWFIPELMASPSKENDHYSKFKGTKKKIFEKAVELFAKRSFEVVTIKDIADEVGIAQSAFYNHFKSKQKILDAIYDFFCHYYIADRPLLEELEPVLRSGNLIDILYSVNYSFNQEYEDLLISSAKIIFQRMFIEERAREIFRDVILDSGVSYAEAFFDRAIEIGRIEPIDTRMVSVFCNMCRHFLFLNWLCNPDYVHYKKLAATQEKLNDIICQYLTDRHKKSNEETE